MAAVQYQIPGGPYIVESVTRQYQIPGGPYVCEIVAGGGSTTAPNAYFVMMMMGA